MVDLEAGNDGEAGCLSATVCRFTDRVQCVVRDDNPDPGVLKVMPNIEIEYIIAGHKMFKPEDWKEKFC